MSRNTSRVKLNKMLKTASGLSGADPNCLNINFCASMQYVMSAITRVYVKHKHNYSHRTHTKVPHVVRSLNSHGAKENSHTCVWSAM